jgi:hypothetical protein
LPDFEGSRLFDAGFFHARCCGQSFVVGDFLVFVSTTYLDIEPRMSQRCDGIMFCDTWPPRPVWRLPDAVPRIHMQTAIAVMVRFNQSSSSEPTEPARP